MEETYTDPLQTTLIHVSIQMKSVLCPVYGYKSAFPWKVTN